MDTNFIIMWISSILVSITIDNSKTLKGVKDISDLGYKIDFKNLKNYKDEYGIIDKSFLLCLIPLLNILYSIDDYKDYNLPTPFIISLLKKHRAIIEMQPKEIEKYSKYNNIFYALILTLNYNLTLIRAKKFYYQDNIIYYISNKNGITILKIEGNSNIDMNNIKELIKDEDDYQKRKLSLQ